MSITRFNIDLRGDTIDDPAGQFVDYDEVESELASRDAQVARMEEGLRRTLPFVGTCTPLYDLVKAAVADPSTDSALKWLEEQKRAAVEAYRAERREWASQAGFEPEQDFIEQAKRAAVREALTKILAAGLVEGGRKAVLADVYVHEAAYRALAALAEPKDGLPEVPPISVSST